jgi:C-terminal processing protease CtpA/Prc
MPATATAAASGAASAAGLAGVGVVFGKDPANAAGPAVVLRLLEGGPAAVSEALAPGDALESVDGADVQGDGMDDIRRRILGQPVRGPPVDTPCCRSPSGCLCGGSAGA